MCGVKPLIQGLFTVMALTQSTHEKFINQALNRFAIRGINQARCVQALLGEHRLGLAEGEKAFAAMVITHA